MTQRQPMVVRRLAVDDRTLVVCANTLRRADFPTRVHAAGQAGFAGIGLRLSDYRQARDAGLSDRDMVSLLDSRGLQLVELEGVWDWVSSNQSAATKAGSEEAIIRHMAEAFGCRHVNISLFFPHDLADIVDAYGTFCDRAAQAGLLVGLEFIPYSEIPTLREAKKIVDMVARVNGGLTLDAWHYFRCGATTAELLALSVSDIVAVQLNDVLHAAAPDLKQEGRHHRQAPGDGAGDLAGFIGAMKELRVEAPVEVEVFSDDLDSMEPAVVARTVLDKTRRVLVEAGWNQPSGRQSGTRW
jgi:sugar phosphate isomerase/epimerase